MSATLPLSGVKILSLAEQYPGPFATMVLADLGADVILVERPGVGDPTRRFSGHFESLNRGKRSISIDLKSQRGRELLLELASGADVLIEGFRPGTMSRLDLSFETVNSLCPELIYVSISAFGQTGPLRLRGAHDLTLQGVAGLLDASSGSKDAYSMPSLPLADISSAMFATIGVLAALYERKTSARGVNVDVSMLESVIAWMTPGIVSSLNGLVPAPDRTDFPGYGIFECQDGNYITLSIAGEDHLWRALCEELGLYSEADYSESDRFSERKHLNELLRDRIRQLDVAELTERFDRRGIAFGNVNRRFQGVEDPQVRARGLLSSVAQENGGSRYYIRQPVVFNGSRADIKRVAPLLGQHTVEVLREIGYSDPVIADLIKNGVVAIDRDEVSGES